MGKKHFCFFQTAETGNRTPNSGVKGSGANHYPRAPPRMTVHVLVNVETTSLFYCYNIIIILCRPPYVNLQRQKAVSAYFTSKQILPLVLHRSMLVKAYDIYIMKLIEIVSHVIGQIRNLLAKSITCWPRPYALKKTS